MRRRDLEQAVIAAAREIVENCRDTDDGMVELLWKWDDLVRLRDAFDNLDKLREVEKPRASRVAPITSHQAAAWVATSSQSSMLGKIFYKVYWSEHRTFHDGFGDTRYYQKGRTADELIVELNRGHATVSARVNELANAGWIVDSGIRRKTRSGREAVVWFASDAAKAAIEEGRRI
jgi:hypothetical protein